MSSCASAAGSRVCKARSSTRAYSVHACCCCCRAAAATVGSSVERWTRFGWRLSASSPSCRLRAPVGFVIDMYLPCGFLERKRGLRAGVASYPSGSRGKAWPTFSTAWPLANEARRLVAAPFGREEVRDGPVDRRVLLGRGGSRMHRRSGLRRAPCWQRKAKKQAGVLECTNAVPPHLRRGVFRVQGMASTRGGLFFSFWPCASLRNRHEGIITASTLRGKPMFWRPYRCTTPGCWPRSIRKQRFYLIALAATVPRCTVEYTLKCVQQAPAAWLAGMRRDASGPSGL